MSTLVLALLGCRPTAKNVVVVCVDTLRADHVGAYGYPRATTPRLDALARQGSVFENALSAAPWTVPAVGSLLTSLYPSQHGAGLAGEVRQLDRSTPAQLRPEAETLADHLHRAKLRTALFSANPYLWGRFQRGFDHAEASHSPAESLTDRALAWVRQAPERPFFLYLQYMDLHQPITPPEPYASHFLVADAGGARRGATPAEWSFVRQEDWQAADFQRFREHKIALYDGALLYVDGEIGRLLDGLRKLGREGETLVVVTADHGEEFWDHGEEERLQGDDPRAIWGVGHGHTLYQELLHVPLILAGPGISAGARIPCPVALLDVAPTILAALKLPPAAGMAGQSLGRFASEELAHCAPRALAAESPAYGPDSRAVLYQGWKLVLRKSAAPALYDLAHDPGEHRNLAGESPRKLAVLTRLLDHELEASAASAAPALPDPETARQLHALGYL